MKPKATAVEAALMRGRSMLQQGMDAPAPFWVSESRSNPQGFYQGYQGFENHHFRSWIEDADQGSQIRISIDPAGWLWSGLGEWAWNVMFWDGQRLWGTGYPHACQCEWASADAALTHTWQCNHIRLSSETRWQLGGEKPSVQRQISIENQTFESQTLWLVLAVQPWGRETAGRIDRIHAHPQEGCRVNGRLALQWEREPDNVLCGPLSEGNLARRLETWQFRLTHKDSAGAAQALVAWKFALRSGTRETVTLRQLLLAENKPRLLGRALFSKSKPLANPSIAVAPEPWPEFRWPTPALDRLWQNTLTFTSKVLRPDAPDLSPREQYLALFSDLLFDSKTRLKARCDFLPPAPRDSLAVFMLTRLALWTDNRDWERDWILPELSAVLKRVEHLRKEDVSRSLAAGAYASEKIQSVAWDVATLSWYAQFGGDTKFKFQAGAELDGLRPGFEKLMWHSPQAEILAPLVWPMGLLAPTHPDMRKLLHARLAPAEPTACRLQSSADQLYALHAALLTEPQLFAAGLRQLLQQPMLGAYPEYWHPQTRYGAGGRGQWPETSLLTLWLLARMASTDTHDVLWLLPGLAFFGCDHDWVIDIKRAVTRFGSMDLWAHMSKHGELELQFEPRYLSTPKDIKLRCPLPLLRAEADGKNISADSQILRFSPRSKKICVLFEKQKERVPAR